MPKDERIVKVNISALPRSLSDPLPEVRVILESGREEKLFDYYPDEISFQAEEFIGLTTSEARRLQFEKDRHFLKR